MSACNPSVLLVEDNKNDAMLARMAMEEGGFRGKVVHVTDGVEAVEFLFGEAANDRAKLPDIVLLDLNMPRMDGRQVLHRIRQEKKFDGLAVYVLTTSDSRSDIEKAYNEKADCYIVKPMNVDEFFDTVKRACLFWCNVVRRAH